MFIETFSKYMKEVFKLDFTNLTLKINHIKNMKEFSDRFYIGYRILELINNIYITNKNTLLNEIKVIFQSFFIMKSNSDITDFSNRLIKYILISDFILDKNIYYDKLGSLLIKINNLYFDFSSDTIKLIDEIYYFDKNYDFMLSQSISLEKYRDGLYEATETDLLTCLIMGNLYPNLSINMPNYVETQALILKSFNEQKTINHNYYCTLLFRNIFNKKTFNEIYHEALASSLSCNNHYVAKIVHGFISNKPLEEISEAVDLYTKYSAFKLNNPESLSDKQKIIQINYILYLYSLIKNNNETANKAFEKIQQFDTGLEITAMSKIEAHLASVFLRLFYKFFNIKKTSSLIIFIILMLKTIHKDKLSQKVCSSEEVCLLLNEPPLSILLNEKIEKNSLIIIEIMKVLNK